MNETYYCGIQEARVWRIGKTWQCVLCDTELENELHRREHTQELCHQQNVVRTLGYIHENYSAITVIRRNTAVVDLESGVDRLQSLNWQLHVQGVLYRYMRLGTDWSLSDELSLLGQAKTLLQKYEQMERLSLLELAVWKAACISHATRIEVDSKMNIKSAHDAILCVAKHQHTWKKYRTETRKSIAIEIIIKHVLPFLGKP
jgi:hypothetical protein